MNTEETQYNDTYIMEMGAFPFSSEGEFPFFPEPGLQQMDISSFGSLRFVVENCSPEQHFLIEPQPSTMTAIEHTPIAPLQAHTIAIDSQPRKTSQHATPVFTAPSTNTSSTSATQSLMDTIDATTFARLLISPSLASYSVALNTPLEVPSSESKPPANSSDPTISGSLSYPPRSRPVRACKTNTLYLSSQSSLAEKTPRRRRGSISASSFTQHFSDLNIDITSTSTSLPPSTTTNISSTPSSMSSLSAPSVYFPPTASALHQKRRKAKRQALRAPRPRNCFMLYRSKVLPQIMVELGTINNKIISKIAAERWRAENEEVKAWYRMMAKRGKEEHARNNPGYKYAPYKKQMMAEMQSSAHGQVPIACGREGGEEMYLPYKMDYGQDLTMDHFNEIKSLEPTPAQTQSSPSKNANAATRLLNVLKGKSSLSSSRSAKRSKLNNESTSSGLSSKLSGLLQPFSNTLNPWASSFTSTGAPVRFANGVGLVEQQLYLASQHKDDQSQQVQLQHQNPSSLYNLDTNPSSATLVDPLQNQWLHQRYHDPAILNNYLGQTTVHQLAQTFSQMKEPSSSSFAVLPYLGSHSDTSLMPLRKTGYDLNKELPPLPNTVTHSDLDIGNSAQEPDCQSIMAQLFASYNGVYDSSLNPLNLQPELYLGHNGMWKHQQIPLQQPPYLIKPLSPQFLSFADLMQPGNHLQGQPSRQQQQSHSSMSMTDLFSWPPPM